MVRKHRNAIQAFGFGLAFASALFAGQASAQQGGPGGRGGAPAPAVGETAPDFSLAPIKFYDLKGDRAVSAEEAGGLYDSVRLSSFRGEKPVVLIFGSYT